MAMSFPDKKVSFDIVEGIAEPRVVRLADGWVSLQASSRHMDDYLTCRRVMQTLSELLRSPAASRPNWEQDVIHINEAFIRAHERARSKASEAARESVA